MLSAILFDLDGTLANTDPLHFKIWQEILAQYGINCDRSFFQEHISGNTNEQLIERVLPHLSLEEGKQLAIDKEAQFRAKATTMQPTPGLERILQLSNKVPLKRAVVTNAPKENAYHMLEALDLTATFPIVVLAQDAPPGKPDPAPYQLALSRLETESQNAIAIEDSTAGIRSAVGAGIYTIGITTSHSAPDLIDAGASMTITDFNDCQLWNFLDRKIQASG